jgi:dUTP pyrophosphatase
MRVSVDRVIAQARLPERLEGDASYDVYAMEHIEIAPLGRAKVRTGLRFDIPSGMYGLILPRTPLAVQHGVTVLNAPGVIDSSYNEEVKVVLFNSDALQAFRVKVGNKIAQLIFMPITDTHLFDLPYMQPQIGDDGEFV